MSGQSIQKIRDKVKRYYSSKILLQWQIQQQKELEQKLAEIETDRNDPYFNRNLSTDICGVSYDGILSDGGQIPASNMEKEIDSIGNRLEREYERTRADLIGLRLLIRDAQRQMASMDFYIGMIEKEHRRVLELKYRQNKSYLQIAFELNMSKTSVCKYLNDAYIGIARLIEYYEN